MKVRKTATIGVIGSDLFAFGAVLYEMLTGRRTFEGADISEVLAGVIKSEPDWSELPPNTPTHIRTLLRRCLRKEPQRRLPHIAVARLEINEGLVESVATAPVSVSASTQVIAQPRLGRRTMLVVAGVILGSALTGVAWWTFRPSTPPPTITRFPFSAQRFLEKSKTLFTIAKCFAPAPSRPCPPMSSCPVVAYGVKVEPRFLGARVAGTK